MASISNDPAGELDPSKTLEINYKGRVRVAKLAKELGVRKYFLASSCSVYGFNENICDENSEIDPLTTYAKASSLAEKDILPLGNQNFSCTCLRFATIYGASNRMRFDLVINAMTLSLFKNRIIVVNGGGNQKRPVIDVNDVANAYLEVIKADTDLINQEIFNIGSNQQNYKIIDLAKEVGDGVGEKYEIESRGEPDFRSYDIDFTKAKKILKFNPKNTPKDSAKKIFKLLSHGELKDTPKTRTVEWYSYLLKNSHAVKDLLINNKLL